MKKRNPRNLHEQELLSTGIPSLDRELEGGLFPGSMVYLISDSMSMAEVFLYHFVQQRQTYYINTERKPEFIIRNLGRLGFETSNLRFIDIHEKYHEKKPGLLDYGKGTKDYKVISFMEEKLKEIEETDINIIIDTVSFFLHRDVKASIKREMLNTIYNTSKKINGLMFLYGLKGGNSNFVENELFNLCDAVFDTSLVKKADRTITELTVPKARDRPVHGTILKFRIDRGIMMDTSKEIA